MTLLPAYISVPAFVALMIVFSPSLRRDRWAAASVFAALALAGVHLNRDIHSDPWMYAGDLGLSLLAAWHLIRHYQREWGSCNPDNGSGLVMLSL